MISDENETDSDKTPILLHPAHRMAMLKRGQDFFNDEKYFEAHEAWEKLWHCEQGRDRAFVQGLIQIAGHFVHLQRANWSGAIGLAGLAKTKLYLPAPHRLYRELDISPLIAALDYNVGLLMEQRLKPKDVPPPPPDAFLKPKLFGKN